METTVKFAKVRPEAIIPSKRDEDAGFDIYACVEWCILKPHETRKIATGIASSCSPEYAFILKERGSTGTLGIAQRCGVIDSGFRGEWFVPVTNTTDKTLFIGNKESREQFINESFVDISNYIFYPTEKAICQAMVVPVPKVTVEEIDYDDLKAIKSERGTGSIGSSNK